MEILPYHRVNGVIINSKSRVVNYDLGFVMSFREYVLSQIHFPIVNGLFGRDLMDYKKVYLYLVVDADLEQEILDRVVKYFYHDFYNSLINKELYSQISEWLPIDFDIDFSSIQSRYESSTKPFPRLGSLDEKIVELDKACKSEKVYILV